MDRPIERRPAGARVRIPGAGALAGAARGCGRRQARAAFTLIEMLVVLVVIAILSLLAIPNYTDRLVRAQIHDALPLAALAQAPVAQQWQNAHTFPADNGAVGLPPPEKIVNSAIASVGIENGAVQIVFGNSANAAIRGKILTLLPAVVEDAQIVPVSWVCGWGPVPGMMTLHGVNRTNIPMELLPASCRGT